MIDEIYDISQSENYNLSIQTVPGELAFCVLNNVLNKYVVLRNYKLSSTDLHSMISECKLIFEHDDLLGLRYQNSRHLLVSPRCTLVPEHLYDDDNADLYMTFNYGKLTDEQTLHNHIVPASLYCIFSYPKAMAALLQLYQPNINLFHHAAPFMESIIGGMYSSTGKPCAAVFFYSCNLDIMVVEKTRLMYYNTFQINAPEDSVYYFTLVLSSLEINPSSTRLIYAGNGRNMPPEIAILNDYVSRTIECEPPTDVTYSRYIPEPLRKDFINLFNLHGCE